jgi:hypothetical protein
VIGAAALGLAIAVSVFADQIFRSDRAANSMAAGCVGLPLMLGGGLCSLMGVIWAIRAWNELSLVERVLCLGLPPAMLTTFLLAVLFSSRRRRHRGEHRARVT